MVSYVQHSHAVVFGLRGAYYLETEVASSTAKNIRTSSALECLATLAEQKTGDVPINIRRDPTFGITAVTIDKKIHHLAQRYSPHNMRGPPSMEPVAVQIQSRPVSQPSSWQKEDIFHAVTFASFKDAQDFVAKLTNDKGPYKRGILVPTCKGRKGKAILLPKTILKPNRLKIYEIDTLLQFELFATYFKHWGEELYKAPSPFAEVWRGSKKQAYKRMRLLTWAAQQKKGNPERWRKWQRVLA